MTDVTPYSAPNAAATPYQVLQRFPQNPLLLVDFSIAAGGQRIIDYNYNFVYINDINLPNNCELRFDDTGFPTRIAGAGTGFRIPIDTLMRKLIITNTGNSTLVGQVAMGVGEYIDNRLTVSGAVSLTKSQNIADFNDINLTASTVYLVAAANANRRSIIIRNVSDTALIRIGNQATVSATRGLELSPSDTVVLDTSAAIYAHRTASAVGRLSVLEVLD